MENLAKRIKLEMSQESADSVDNEKSVFDEIPDEVLEMIIKYVPCKKACFLVNKRFNKEASNATRNCRLVLDEHSIKDVETITQIVRKFDELRLDLHGSYIEQYHERKTRLTPSTYIQYIRKIVERFKLQIKKLTMISWSDYEWNVLMLLGLLTNLEELDLEIHELISSKANVINIPHLTSLKVTSEVRGNKLFNSLYCPALEKLVLNTAYGKSDASNFIRRHQHLQHLTIHCTTLGEIQNILAIDDMEFLLWDISSLINHKQLKTLNLSMSGFLIDNEGLCSITKLSKLETLSLHLVEQHNEPLSKVLIAEILQMKQLKSLIVSSRDVQLIKPLSTVENLRLEELSIEMPEDIKKHRPLNQLENMKKRMLQSFTENLPNLKKLSLCGFEHKAAFNMVSLLPNLEFVKFTEILDSWSDAKLKVSGTNLKIRQLELKCVDRNFIDACIETMPNVTKLTLFTFYMHFPTYLKFSKLEELYTDPKHILRPIVIALIKEQGQQLKKIIATSARNQAKELVRHYGREFPIQKMNSGTEELTLIRS